MAAARPNADVSLSFVDLMACGFLGMVMLLFVALAASRKSDGESAPFVIATLYLIYSPDKQPVGPAELQWEGNVILWVDAKGGAWSSLGKEGSAKPIVEKVTEQSVGFNTLHEPDDPKPRLAVLAMPVMASELPELVAKPGGLSWEKGDLLPMAAADRIWKWTIVVIFETDDSDRVLNLYLPSDPALRPTRIVAAVKNDDYDFRSELTMPATSASVPTAAIDGKHRLAIRFAIGREPSVQEIQTNLPAPQPASPSSP